MLESRIFDFKPLSLLLPSFDTFRFFLCASLPITLNPRAIYSVLVVSMSYRVYSVPDYLYPSDNPLGIPSLRLDRQATWPVLPISCWGRLNASWLRNAGTIHFYTDDRRFMSLISRPELLVNLHPCYAVEPNFSLGPQVPLSVGLFYIFWKRWLARFWQDHDVGIYVDLSVSERFRDANLLGVPRGWRAFATRGYQGNTAESILATHDLAVEIAGTDDVYFLVYGGNSEIRDLCMSEGFVWVPEDAHLYEKRKSHKHVQRGSVIAPVKLPERRDRCSS